MFIFESLDWAMGFQWPVIIVFAALLAIGIGRLMTWSEEEREHPGNASLKGSQKKRSVRLRSEVNLARPARCLIKGMNVKSMPGRTLRRHVRRHGRATAARSRQG